MEMFYLNDGTREAIFNDEQFEDLLRDKLSSSVAIYYKEKISELKEKADYTAIKVNTDLDSYESDLEFNRNCFLELYDMVEELERKICEKRTTKLDISNLLKRMERKISSQI